jgi:hypothetical protein
MKRLYQERIKPHIYFWLVLLAFMTLVTIKTFIHGAGFDSFSATQNIKMLFVLPSAFLIPLLIKEKFPLRLIKYVLVFSLSYNLLYELIQILVFYTTHRLPSLSFGPFFPRYGGGWDDPNSFAAFAVLLLITWIVAGYRKNKLVDLAVIVAITLLTLLTYSLTAILGLFIISVLLLLLRSISAIKAAMLAGTILLFSLAHYFLGLIPLLIQAKQQSSTGHLSHTPSSSTASGAPGFLDYLFGTPGAQIFHENIYIQLFYNFGLVGVVLFVLIYILTVIATIRGMMRYQGQKDIRYKFFLISFVYLVAYLFMNFGIPNAQIFPINFFTVVIVGFVWALSEEISLPNLLGLDLIKRVQLSLFPESR